MPVRISSTSREARNASKISAGAGEIGVREKQRESALVVASGQTEFRDDVFEALCDGLEQPFDDRDAVPRDKRFTTVEREDHNGRLRAVLLNPIELLSKAITEIAGVRESRLRVGHGDLFEGRISFGALQCRAELLGDTLHRFEVGRVESVGLGRIVRHHSNEATPDDDGRGGETTPIDGQIG